jgi:hypothetical protein
MKYVYTAGKYAEFRGYVFANGNPVTILDRGTLEAIAKRPDFKEAKDEQKVEETPAAPEVLKRPTLTVKKRK